MKRPVLNIDIDNCIYDFSAAIKAEGERFLGRELNSDKWNMWEDWGISVGLWKRIFREGVAAGRIWSEGAVIPGAAEALWELSDSEYYIRLVTHRLNHGFDFRTAVNATALWLDDNKIPYRSLCVIGEESKALYHAEALVDDAIHNIDDWKDSGKRNGLLFDRPWNRKYLTGGGCTIRVTSWPSVVLAVKVTVKT